MTGTVLERVAAAVRASCEYNQNVQGAPVALLWTDESGQWAPVVAHLGEHLSVVTLGAYDPERRRGPAYWIRCVVAGTIDLGLPEEPVVVYMPEVPRSAIRAADDCSAALAPIAELQYRSQWFANPKGRDWTVRALLSDAHRGLGLDVADDASTTRALLGALDRLVDERMDRLAHVRIDADFCNQLLNPDPVRNLLGWIDDPTGHRAKLTKQQWAAFVATCSSDFQLDPERDGVLAGAAKLGGRRESWDHAWARYVESPGRYPGIPEQLRRARPEGLTTEQPDSWPQDNEIDEDYLRNQLRDFAVLTPESARKQASELDREHSARRRTVWANLGKAPLAFAVEQLAALAEVTARPLVGTDLGALVADYTARGWTADDAFVRALAAARGGEDRAAVTVAAETIYRPWAAAAAAAMQVHAGQPAGTGTYTSGSPMAPTAGTAVVFVDGLRLDLAQRLRERLGNAGLAVTIATALAALPTITATAKAAVVPVASGALVSGPELSPCNGATGTKAGIDVLRALMTSGGVQVLGATDTGDPCGTAWTEAGDIDGRGHDLGARLVDELDDEVERVTDRVRELLAAGWFRVELCTDHGWLLLPGRLDKVELPVSTTSLKKGRCARLKDGAVVDVPTVPWFWDDDVRIAVAPGISCFEAGTEYSHGGVSPQECVVPRMSVTAGSAPPGGAEIVTVKWLGLLCRFEVAGAGGGLRADLRGLAGDPATSIAETAKETSPRGRMSLVIRDEDLEGQPAHLVLVDTAGTVVVDRPVVIGSNRS